MAEGRIRTPGTGFSQYNGLANSRFHTLLFGINRLRSDELPHCWAKSHCSGTFVQLLCNRYFALNTKKLITITKAFRPACSTLLLRQARFFVQVVCTNLLRVHVQAAAAGLKTRMGCAGSSGGLLLISKKYGQCESAASLCRFRAVRRSAPVKVSGVAGGECSSFTATR